MLPPEGPEDDGEDLGPPLPPEDRLWRHPSEMGAAAMASPVRPTPVARPARTASPWLVGAVAGLTGAVATLAAVVAFGGFDRGGVQQTVVERVAVAPTVTLPVSIGGPAQGDEAVAAVAADVGPAVARIEVTRAASDGSETETTTTTGSAVLFRDDGYLLTSADLVAHSVSIAVVLGDGDLRDGRVVGTDELTDVAVLKIEGEGLPTAVLGSIDDLAVGQPTLIVGAPGSPGDDSPVTSGIVSALGRTLAATTAGAPTRHDMIQTDAPLDPSATGGALVDRRGAVVGITTDPPDTPAGGGGLSFATPIDTARDIAGEIILTGTAHHSWLGIEGSDVEARQADDLPLGGGARVATVADGSPADEAGLATDDVITSVDGIAVTSMADLVIELRHHEPGATILIAYVRDGRPGFAVAHLGDRA